MCDKKSSWPEFHIPPGTIIINAGVDIVGVPVERVKAAVTQVFKELELQYSPENKEITLSSGVKLSEKDIEELDRVISNRIGERIVKIYFQEDLVNRRLTDVFLLPPRAPREHQG